MRKNSFNKGIFNGFLMFFANFSEIYSFFNYQFPAIIKLRRRIFRIFKWSDYGTNDSNIVNKVLNTNSKLDVTYTDSDNKTDTKSTDITPKVKLTENLPTVLPKAGSTIFFSFMGIVLVIAVAFGI